jgi:hypothetical protein
MRVLIPMLALCFVAAPAAAQPTSTPTVTTPFATYANDAAHEAQAAHLRAGLDHAGIHHSTTCSATCTVSVETRRYGDANYVLSMLVVREHVDISTISVPTS